MSAMRSLPHRVIALLGMNDGLFPRGDHSVGFDLMRIQRVLGDTHPRDEDRHLFLEAVLSAKDRLIITYQGQDVRDQRPRPPSVPVQELLDVLSQTDEVGVSDEDDFDEDEPLDEAVSNEAELTVAAGEIRDVLFVRHPLQAFSPRYFDGNGGVPGSFNVSALSAAQHLQSRSDTEAAFVAQPLPWMARVDQKPADHSNDLQSINVGDLRVLHERPWQLFLKRLGIGNLSVSEDATDREPLVVAGLQYWQVGDEWLERSLAGDSPVEIGRHLVRTGRIPAGSAGESIVRKLKQDACRITNAMDQGNVQEASEPLPVNLLIGEFQLTGELRGWTGSTLRQATFSKVSEKHVVRFWIDYLTATAACHRILEPAVLVGRDNTSVTFSELKPDEAVTHLETLIKLWQIAQCFPLPFLINDKVFKPVSKGEVDFSDHQSTTAYIAAARNSFVQQSFAGGSSGRRQPAPAEEPDARTAFAGLRPFDLQCDAVPALAELGERNLFAHLAEKLCSPLVAHLESFSS